MKTTFATEVKEEIVSGTYSLNYSKSLLSAYIRVNGHYKLSSNGSSLLLKTNNAKIAKFIYQTIKDVFNPDISFNFVKGKNLSKVTSYETTINSNADEILDKLGIDFLESKINRLIVCNDETIAAYLAGLFLATGSINSPTSSKYHLELVLNSEAYAKEVVRQFSRYKSFDFIPKIINRRDSYVVYMKRSDKIADFLIMIQAINSCMKFENIRVDRDFMNTTNRLTNFDIANMERTVEKANQQIKQIKYIDNVLGIHNIPNKKVRLLCELRLKNESSSLADLALKMGKELQEEISKSAIARLFTKISNLAEKLKYENYK